MFLLFTLVVMSLLRRRQQSFKNKNTTLIYSSIISYHIISYIVYGLHESQLDAPGPEKPPLGHGVHVLEAAWLNVPAKQS